MEFQRGCEQMGLASACVLRPLNHLVLDFETRGVGGMNERRSGVYRTGDDGGDYSEGRS